MSYSLDFSQKGSTLIIDERDSNKIKSSSTITNSYIRGWQNLKVLHTIASMSKGL